MLYYLGQLTDLWGALNVFRYVTFRCAFAALFAFMVTITLGAGLIAYLRHRRIGENTDKTDAAALAQLHAHKRGIPTMGGLLIVGATAAATLLWARWDVFYTWLSLVVMGQLGAIGVCDDLIKLKDPKSHGLRAREKLCWQLLVGLTVGLALYLFGDARFATAFTVPFLKPELFAPGLGLFFVFAAALVIAATANAVNLSDGLDGLAIGTAVIVALAYMVIAYATGTVSLAEYLRLPPVPGAEELAVVCAALVGAGLGFLWFNAYPAEVFMGNTGSLAVGGLIGAVALVVKQELLLVVVGGVFVIEAASVIIQVWHYRRTGKRFFKMAPLHHHLQLSGWSESKITIRFWICGLVLAIFSIVTLKMR